MKELENRLKNVKQERERELKTAEQAVNKAKKHADNLTKQLKEKEQVSLFLQKIIVASLRSICCIKIQLDALFFKLYKYSYIYTIAKKKKRKMHIFKGRVKGRERNGMAAI